MPCSFTNARPKLLGDVSNDTVFVEEDIQSQVSTGVEPVGFGVEEVIDSVVINYTTAKNIATFIVLQERTGVPSGASVLRMKIRRGGLGGFEVGTLDITSNGFGKIIGDEIDRPVGNQTYSLTASYPGSSSFGSDVPTYDTWNGIAVVSNVNDTHHCHEQSVLP